MSRRLREFHRGGGYHILMTEIIFAKKIIGPGKWQIDLIAKDLPANFLGMAVDLQFNGDWNGVNYQGMEWGPVLGRLPLEKQPIKMVKALPEQGRLVTGLTFKANQLVEIDDGMLASFVFEGAELQLDKLLNPVVSIYENGRKDWPVVGWTIQDTSKAVNSLKVLSENKITDLSKNTMENVEIAELVDVDEVSVEQAETNFDSAALKEILNRPQPSAVPNDFGWWWVIFLIILPLVMVASGWGLWQAYRRTRADKVKEQMEGYREGQTPKGDFRASNKAEFA